MTALSKPSNVLSPVNPCAASSRLENAFSRALEERTFSGASLLVATPERIEIEMVFGRCRTGGRPLNAQTWFDLASLTKPLVSSSLCILALGRNMFALDDPLRLFFPPGAIPPGKRSITVRQLLNHCSGLPPYKPWYRELIQIPPGRRSAALLSMILETPLLSAPGRASFYSDLGFLLLGILLEGVFGAPLDELASSFLFRPNDITALSFLRLEGSCDPAVPPERHGGKGLHFAATEECPWRKRLLEGEVHDENAFCLQGVAGHAGLFGTARGVFSLISSLWRVYRGVDPGESWPPEHLRDFWKRQGLVEGSTWALGFDTPSIVGSSSGNRFSAKSVGHLGFTGTSFWLDLEREILIILLTNRVHPTREHERLKIFRPLVHNLVMEAIDDLS